MSDISELSIGTVLDDSYEVLADLGQGSFGRVHQARQLSTGQIVAVKTLRPSREATNGTWPTLLEEFRAETKLFAELSHPNIVRLIDSGEIAGGCLYTAFEFIRGASLSEVLSAEGKLGVAESVHLMTQILDALSCAHARGIVHRDLKPDNIMITKTGARRNAVLLDFGLGGFARPSEARRATDLAPPPPELLGTACYAAPEQLRGEPATPSSDLYSWGITLLQCLTGDRPFHGASGQEVILKQLGPEPVAIPAWLRNHPLGRVLEIVTSKRAEKRDVPIERLLRMLSAVGHGDLSEDPDTHADAEVFEQERRQLTLVCCQVTIATDEGSAADLEETDQALRRRQTALIEKATAAGGVVATILADRVLFMFGYPRAREGDARRAARFALGVAAGAESPTKHLRIDVRAGVHTGLVLIRSVAHWSMPQALQLTGLTPQVASHLAERAQPGQVLVSAETHRLLRREFDTQPFPDAAVGAGQRTVSAFRLIGGRRTAIGNEVAAQIPETPLVGRGPQLQRLLDGWVKAGAGHSSAMLITGEPGIGKSRLLRELQRQVGPEAWIELACAPEDQTAPLRPVIDALQSMERPLESLLAEAGLDATENLPLFAALLSYPLDERYAPLHLSPERQKELTLQALVSLLLKMSEPRPIVLAIENLHWADPSTLELATLLIQTLRSTGASEGGKGPKLYLVFTTRPEFIPSWTGEDISFLPLPRLTQGDVEELVRASLTESHQFSPALAEQVTQRAEGIPLFVEEIARVMLQTGGDTDGGEQPGISSPVEIPGSIRDLLTARLDGVSAPAHDTAQLGAVLGREFRYELLEAVSEKDSSFLRQDLTELGNAGLVVQRRVGNSVHYAFRHALLRDAAYEELTRATRQGLHRRVASALQRQFPDIEQGRPEIVALHFEQAAENFSAAAYWRRAGDQALRQAAYIEATHQLERGLRLLHQEEPGRQDGGETEIELLTTLGTVQFMTKGYAAAEVEQTFGQAWELCERLADEVPVKILHGIWAVEIARGNREAIDKLLPRVSPLIRADDPVSALSGYGMLGANAFWRGNFSEANEKLTLGRQLYETPAFERFARDYGYDGGLDLYGLGICALWQLGYADQAEALRREMLSLAEHSNNPYSLAIALGWGTAVTHDRGDAATTIELSQRLSALGTEQHLYLWLAPATCALGGAFLLQGDADSALPIIQQGLGLYQGFGVLSSYSYYLTYLAAAHVAARHVDDGLAVIAEGEALADRLVVQFHRPELLRLKGELLLLKGEATAAESGLRCALDLARAQQGKAYELRAALSLSRLLAAQSHGSEARSLLRPVYDWFTEGFETKDLRDARTLLDDLA